MKYTIEIPDQEAGFVLELLRRVTSVKMTPVRDKNAEADATDYVFSNPANARALDNFITQIEEASVTSSSEVSAEERERRFLALFGTWQSDKTGDELNQMLRESRHFSRPDVSL